MGGALFVSLALPAGISATAAAANSRNSLDPTQLASWLEIRHDNTIIVRTGRTETGTGMSGYYAQTIAEELRVRAGNDFADHGRHRQDAGRRLFRRLLVGDGESSAKLRLTRYQALLGAGGEADCVFLSRA